MAFDTHKSNNRMLSSTVKQEKEGDSGSKKDLELTVKSQRSEIRKKSVFKQLNNGFKSQN